MILDLETGTVEPVVAKARPRRIQGPSGPQGVRPNQRWVGYGVSSGRVWLWEPRSRQVVLRGPEADTLLGTLAAPPLTRSRTAAVPRALLPNGHAVYEELLTVNALPAIELHGRMIFTADSLGRVVDTVAIVHQGKIGLTVDTNEGSINLVQPWSYSDHVAISPNGQRLAVVRQHEPSGEAVATLTLEMHELYRREVTVREVAYSPERLPEAALSAYMRTESIRRLVHMFADTSLADSVVRAKVVVPKYMPPVRAIRIGDDGSVGLLHDFQDGRETWLALWAGTRDPVEVALPPGYRLLGIGRGYLWAARQQASSSTTVAQFLVE